MLTTFGQCIPDALYVPQDIHGRYSGIPQCHQPVIQCDHIAGSLIQYDSINPWPVSGQEQADLEKRQQQICDLFRDKYTLLEQ